MILLESRLSLPQLPGTEASYFLSLDRRWDSGASSDKGTGHQIEQCPSEATAALLLLPAAALAQEAEKLEVQPDERHEKPESTVPLHVLRCLALHPVLDEVEVEHEV